MRPVGIVLILGLWAVDAAAVERVCRPHPVTVTAATSDLAARACVAVDDALPVLAQCDVTLDRPERIEVLDSLPDACMGLYHCGRDLIQVLAPAAIARVRHDDSAFKALPSDVYFDSVIAHELAHAAYDTVPCPFGDCPATSEYIAYAMQILSLPPDDQARFEGGVAMDVKVGRDSITALTLRMAPDLFAQNVWAHFNQRDDGCDFVKLLMSGAMYLDTDRP